MKLNFSLDLVIRIVFSLSQVHIYKRRSPMDPFPRTCKCSCQTRIYLQQLCKNTGCNVEAMPETVDDGWMERDRESGKSVLAAWHDDDI